MLGVLAVGLLQVSCEPPTDPLPLPARRLMVQAVIDPGAAVGQLVKVDWTNNTGFNSMHVAGADVSILAPDGIAYRGTEEQACDADSNCENFYRIFGLGAIGVTIIPGGTYTLRVRTPTGEEASGTTTVPFVWAANSDVVREFARLTDTLRLDWPRVSSAKGYQVIIQSTIVVSPGRESSRNYTFFADTSITVAGTARTDDNLEVFRYGSRATISVVAVDDNYYTYYHPTVDPFAGAPPSRLTGAIGVFGSIALVRSRVYSNVY